MEMYQDRLADIEKAKANRKIEQADNTLKVLKQRLASAERLYRERLEDK